MSNITVTADQVAMNKPCECCTKPFIASAAITKGQALYVTTAGKVDLLDCNDTGKEQFIGISLTKAAAGQVVDVLMGGGVAGFDLSGVAYGAALYGSDTAGAVADAKSSTKEVRIGRCLPKSDTDLTKSLHVDASLATVW